MMNEFVGKKLGELLAFNRVGVDTYEKGRVALVQALGEEKVMDIEEKDRMHGEAVMRAATEGGVIDVTLAKAAVTEEKIKKMRDLYVADQWDNATELMEWSGFFEGAAVVHWALMRGAAQGMNNEELLALAEEGINWHYEMIEVAEGHLEKIAQDKVAAE
jgi:Holliday junction resolvase